MSLTRGKYGIEYTARSDERGGGHSLGALAAIVAVLAAASLAVSLFQRGGDDPAGVEPLPEIPPPPVVPLPASASANPVAPSPASASAAEAPRETRPASAAQTKPPPQPPIAKDVDERPQKVRSLLMRLDKAEENRDAAMAATTIEAIRSLPGQPAADIDDKLARRLGELNLELLFERRSSNALRNIRVKQGDTASRIAKENGMTLAMFKRLNPKINIDRLIAGSAVTVLQHPNFQLVAHVRTRLADLYLGGRFFKRYDLAGAVKGAAGRYEVDGNLRKLFSEKGVTFSEPDRAELEMLIPRKAVLMIADP